jgi:thymidylate synthase (FAD)
MKCELISSLGDDLTVVNSARVSFENESSWKRNIPALGITELSDKDKKLIKYLAKHKHFTPFTHCVITVREEVPIFVARQRFNHPDEWRKRAENKKQGSEDKCVSSQQLVNKKYDEFLVEAKALYDNLLSMDVAPEQARMVLPQSMYTSYYVTGSLSAFARAYKLRIDEHAQKEIQYLATMWNEVIEPLYPVSWKELTNG